ncbi:MAG: DUF4186 domain-containing protein [Planctomycetales bacterium]|nr:DUF4186 domain-containing protein [Planctomycetales bacterium]
MPTTDAVLKNLQKSSFRRRFRLHPEELACIRRKGLAAMERHAADFVRRRLAVSHPANDGKQTPMKGHPVFVAQHATATCCRRCLEKWHRIPAGRPIDAAEQAYIVRLILSWIQKQCPTSPIRTPVQDRDLFSG